MRARSLFLAFVLTSPALAGASERTPDNPDQEPFLVHVKTALSVDDAQICVVPNVAWAALEAGHPVTVLFDGSACTRG